MALKITQTGSVICCTEKQRKAMKGLGLRRIRDAVVREDNASTRGLCNLVSHLVTWETTDEPLTPGLRKKRAQAK